MKKNLVWCVWYRGKLSKGQWLFFQVEATRGEAERLIRTTKAYREEDLMQFRITRHEVEGPK